MAVAYIFGYGSLVDPHDHMIVEHNVEVVYGVLTGFQRNWSIAIDNSARERDHKHYLTESNERFSGQVAMLGLEPHAAAECNGVALRVEQQLFDDINRRETGIYQRSGDLRAYFSQDLDLPLYAFLSAQIGKENHQRGIEQGNLVVPQEYYRLVEDAFTARSKQALLDYHRTTLPPAEEAIFRQLRLWRKPGREGI